MYPTYSIQQYLVGQVRHTPDGGLEGWRIDIVGHGDDNFHVVGDRPRLELALGLKGKKGEKAKRIQKFTEKIGEQIGKGDCVI